MSFDQWIAFALVYFVISIVPGPSVLMVLGTTLSHGMRGAFWLVLGDIVGGLAIISLSSLGIGAILASSAMGFAVLKWAGVAYLIWLGLGQIRTARRPIAHRTPTRSNRRFAAGFWTGVLNPKAIVFYMAFLAPFLNPDAPQIPQLVTIAATASIIVFAVLMTYAALARRAQRLFRRPAAHRNAQYAGGACLIGGGVWMAAAR